MTPAARILVFTFIFTATIDDKQDALPATRDDDDKA